VAGTAVLGRLTRLHWRIATVREVRAETPSARTITLDIDGWDTFRAGQHVDVRLTAEDGYQAERSYSISSAPEDDTVQITVDRIDDGEVSPYFVDELRVGDVFELRGPIGGHFTWSVDDGRPLLLVGGGSGLAPLMSMLRHRAARRSTVQAHLLLSARGAGDVLYADELASLEPREGLRIAQTFTREPPPGWDGWARRVDAEMLAEISPGPTTPCFVCGPTPFVEWVTDRLVDNGHAPEALHLERFGPTGGR
jgi:ferredoxin-NADP reductase